MELLQQVYFGNTVLQWGLALLVSVAIFIAFQIVKNVVIRRLKKLAERTETELDDVVIDLLHSTKSLLLVALSLYAGSFMLELPGSTRDLLTSAATVLFLLQAGFWGHHLITFFLNSLTRQRMDADDPSSATVVTLLGTVARVAFYAMIALVALGTLGFNVMPLITGLGIGGLALGLAVQGILKDLFGSLAIALDKPFEIGDFITTGDFMGTVEDIGLKSTRLRSNTGEQLVMSNNDLLGSRLRNFGRMTERRGNVTLGVTYDTPADKLRAIPGILEEIIEGHEMARCDRAHFASFGDSALNFAVVYWIESAAYRDFMDTTQEINLEIYRRFGAEGIEFAYPTQTIFVNKGDSTTPEAGTVPAPA